MLKGRYILKTKLQDSIILVLVACLLFIPSTFAKTLEEVNQERSYHRIKEAVLWSQGMMGVALSLDAIQKLGGDYNDIAYLSQPANWKWQILTPNSVSLYLESVINGSVNYGGFPDTGDYDIRFFFNDSYTLEASCYITVE